MRPKFMIYLTKIMTKKEVLKPMKMESMRKYLNLYEQIIREGLLSLELFGILFFIFPVVLNHILINANI